MITEASAFVTFEQLSDDPFIDGLVLSFLHTIYYSFCRDLSWEPAI